MLFTFSCLKGGKFSVSKQSHISCNWLIKEHKTVKRIMASLFNLAKAVLFVLS